MNKFKIRTVLGLSLLYVSIYLNFTWVWSVLFLVWLIPDVYTGTAYFIEPVKRKSHPVLYWLIIVTWLFLAIYPLVTGSLPWNQNQVKFNAVEKTTHLRAFIATKSAQEASSFATFINNKMSRPQIDYVSRRQESPFNIFGLRSQLNWNDKQMSSKISKAVDLFYQNNAIQLDSNLDHSKLHIVYSDMNWEETGDFNLLVGYKPHSIDYLNSVLTSIEIPSNQYAVFAYSNNDYVEWITDTWQRIIYSDLDIRDDIAYEVYQLNRSYKVTGVEIQVPIN